MDEYNKVLRRPKFGFSEWEITSLMEPIVKIGISVVPKPLPEVLFTNECDKKFYEVAKFCHAHLITGNIKHYPQDGLVTTVADFYGDHF